LCKSGRLLGEIDAVKIDEGIESMYPAQAIGRVVAMNELVYSAIYDTVEFDKTLLGKICEIREPCRSNIKLFLPAHLSR
jgi:hypothetical protein